MSAPRNAEQAGRLAVQILKRSLPGARRRNCRCHLEALARRAVAMEMQTRSMVLGASHEPIPGLDALPLLANARATVASNRKT
jgi:hypothetical protein